MDFTQDEARQIMDGALEGKSSFCKHGVFLGDANPNRPCPDCLVVADTSVDREETE